MSDKAQDLIVLLVIVVVLIVAVPMLMWGLMWGFWGGSHMQGMMGFGWGFMSLIPLAFLVLLAVGVYYVIKELTQTERAEPEQGKRALEILKERYARGELTKEEYQKMKEELES